MRCRISCSSCWVCGGSTREEGRGWYAWPCRCRWRRRRQRKGRPPTHKRAQITRCRRLLLPEAHGIEGGDLSLQEGEAAIVWNCLRSSFSKERVCSSSLQQAHHDVSFQKRSKTHSGAP